MISLLRIARPSTLVTAQVFEDLFAREFGAVFRLRHVSPTAWADAILGPPGAPASPAAAARAFREAVRGVDVWCPGYECLSLVPEYTWLRNRAGARARLLLIAHSGGATPLEWALLAPLLAPGDVVVAPSASARAAIVALHPGLAPFLHVIHHPMAPLPGGPRAPQPLLVSLGRLHAGKFLHRQLDALAWLHDHGRAVPDLVIAGPLAEGGRTEPMAYVQGLRAQAARLGLGGRVRFSGAVIGPAAKGQLLGAAHMVLNLSGTLEESFPKTPVEALGVGTPVLGTWWNGVRDTVGDCGTLLPIQFAGTLPEVPDVAVPALAEAIEALLDHPVSPERCRARAAQFTPERMIAAYQRTLTAALEGAGPGPDEPPADRPAAPATGLLSAAAPLPQVSWASLFGAARAASGWWRAQWAAPGSGTPPAIELYRRVVEEAVRPALERTFAGQPAGAAAMACGAPGQRFADAADSVAVMHAAATGRGVPSGRCAALRVLVAMGETSRAAEGLASVRADGADGPATSLIALDLLALAGRPGAALSEALAALAPSRLTDREVAPLRQLAVLARQAGAPAIAMPSLAEWLDRHPDSQESGPVWLELAANGLQAGGAALPLAARALERARALLGQHPVVLRLTAALDQALLLHTAA